MKLDKHRLEGAPLVRQLASRRGEDEDEREPAAIHDLDAAHGVASVVPVGDVGAHGVGSVGECDGAYRAQTLVSVSPGLTRSMALLSRSAREASKASNSMSSVRRVSPSSPTSNNHSSIALDGVRFHWFG